MNQIPFPNSHDMDDLNTWLDARAAGTPMQPVNEVEVAADSFHALAESARATAPGYRAAKAKGDTAMQAMRLTATPPASRRTRRQATVPSRNRGWPWISAAMVLLLLLGTFVFALIDPPGSNRKNNVAYAPQTASPMAEEPFDWTAPISPRECPEDEVIASYDADNPSGVLYTREDYDQVSSERDYEIIGPASREDANAVVSRMREVQGCTVYAKKLPWWSARFEYENRTTTGRASLEANADQRASAEATIGAWYEDELGLTPADMWVEQNPADLTLVGSEALVTQGLFNPDHAVQFADGRIGIIHSVVTYEPVEHEIAPYYSPNMLIFVFQDGQWMLDETLPICFGDCSAVATPVSTGGDIAYPLSTPLATPEA